MDKIKQNSIEIERISRIGRIATISALFCMPLIIILPFNYIGFIFTIIQMLFLIVMLVCIFKTNSLLRNSVKELKKKLDRR